VESIRRWERRRLPVGTGRLERHQPIGWNPLSAELGAGALGRGVAVPVRPTGPEQPQRLRVIGESSPSVRVVHRVSSLDGIEPLGFERGEGRSSPPILEVRGGDEAPAGVHQIRNRLEAGKPLLDKSRAAVTDEPVEGVLHAGHRPPAQQRPRDVRPAHGPTSGLGQHIVLVDGKSESLEPLDHLDPAALAVRAAAGQEGLQWFPSHRQEIPEHMHFSPGRRHRELATRDDADPKPGTSGERSGDSVERVVVRQGDRAEARLRGPGNDLLGREGPVRGRAVQVEIDRARRDLRGGAQREYPVSGAVQEGWERWNNSVNR